MIHTEKKEMIVRYGVKQRPPTEKVHNRTVGINSWLEPDEIEILINDDGTIGINVNPHSECFADIYYEPEHKRRVVVLRDVSVGNIACRRVN